MSYSIIVDTSPIIARTLNATIMQITEKIATTLQPEGRGKATAASFSLFMSASDISEADMKEALRYLGQPRDGEEGPIVSRRRTCAEVSALIEGRLGTLTGAVAAWRKWAEYLREEIATIPAEQKGRYQAMLETAERELSELEDAAWYFEIDFQGGYTGPN